MKREPSPDLGGRCHAKGVTDEGIILTVQQPFFVFERYSSVWFLLYFGPRFAYRRVIHLAMPSRPG